MCVLVFVGVLQEVFEMSGARWMILFLIGLLRMTAILMGAGDVSGAMVADTNCVCGVFNVSSVALEDPGKPLLKSPVDVVASCDKVGHDMCSKTCVDVAKSFKKISGSILCALVKHDHVGFQVALYHNACNNGWMYTGVTSSEKLCCHNSSPVSCMDKSHSDL